LPARETQRVTSMDAAGADALERKDGRAEVVALAAA
jgi:hypothetical protein